LPFAICGSPLILSETLCADALASLSRRLPRAFHFVLCYLPVEHRLPLSLTWSSSLSFGLGMISARVTAAGPGTQPDVVDLLALCSYPYPMIGPHSPIPCLWLLSA